VFVALIQSNKQKKTKKHCFNQQKPNKTNIKKIFLILLFLFQFKKTIDKL